MHEGHPTANQNAISAAGQSTIPDACQNVISDAIRNVIYLASCVVNNQIPEKARVQQMDLDALYQAAKRHSLTAITAYALESADVQDSAFTQAKAKAIRKNIIMDTERAAILQKMEKAGIWYMPLKGIVLQEMYPAIGMRQMSDNDILFDGSRAKDVRAIMEEQGFQTKYFGLGIHDCYCKEPVCNFEMHRALFIESHDNDLWKYYGDIKSRLVKDERNAYGYHFKDEDGYIYLTAHEYKHYSVCGTGLRSLLDTYVLYQHKGKTMDWTYVTNELETLGIADFERQSRNLALNLFGGSLTSEEYSMLDYFLSSGTYGTVNNRIENGVEKNGGGFGGKVRYLFSRIFLTMPTIKSRFPLFAEVPILLPLFPIYRFFLGCFKYNKNMKAELKALSEYEKK